MNRYSAIANPDMDVFSGEVTGTSAVCDSEGGGSVFQCDFDTTGPTEYLPGTDHRGNVVLLVSESTGAMVAEFDGGRQPRDGRASLARRASASGCPLGARRWQYDPYGQTLRKEGAYDKIPFRYQTKWDIDFSGLIDYGLRWHQPSNGRFLNRDPIGEAGGNNLYEAFGGDPVNRWDVLGLQISLFPTSPGLGDYYRGNYLASLYGKSDVIQTGIANGTIDPGAYVRAIIPDFSISFFVPIAPPAGVAGTATLTDLNKLNANFGVGVVAGGKVSFTSGYPISSSNPDYKPSLFTLNWDVSVGTGKVGVVLQGLSNLDGTYDTNYSLGAGVLIAGGSSITANINSPTIVLFDAPWDEAYDISGRDLNISLGPVSSVASTGLGKVDGITAVYLGDGKALVVVSKTNGDKVITVVDTVDASSGKSDTGESGDSSVPLVPVEDEEGQSSDDESGD